MLLLLLLLPTQLPYLNPPYFHKISILKAFPFRLLNFPAKRINMNNIASSSIGTLLPLLLLLLFIASTIMAHPNGHGGHQDLRHRRRLLNPAMRRDWPNRGGGGTVGQGMAQMPVPTSGNGQSWKERHWLHPICFFTSLPCPDSTLAFFPPPPHRHHHHRKQKRLSLGAGPLDNFNLAREEQQQFERQYFQRQQNVQQHQHEDEHQQIVALPMARHTL